MMTDDLHALLHRLADRIADGLARDPVGLPADDAQTTLVLAALDALATGDVSLSVAARLTGTSAGIAMEAALRRVRALVLAARASAHAGSQRMDDVRSAAERAAEGALRERVVLDRGIDQLRQIAQSAGELSNAALELGEVCDRTSLMALNVGIEGLRVGGDVARTLGSLGDELRKQTLGAGTHARDVASGLRAVGEQARAVLASVEEARTAAQKNAEDATRAAVAAQSAQRADAALVETVAAFRALDDESERLISRLETAADATARDIAAARTRAATSDAPGRDAILAAVARLEHAVQSAGEAPRAVEKP